MVWSRWVHVFPLPELFSSTRLLRRKRKQFSKLQNLFSRGVHRLICYHQDQRKQIQTRLFFVPAYWGVEKHRWVFLSRSAQHPLQSWTKSWSLLSRNLGRSSLATLSNSRLFTQKQRQSITSQCMHQSQPCHNNASYPQNTQQIRQQQFQDTNHIGLDVQQCKISLDQQFGRVKCCG